MGSDEAARRHRMLPGGGATHDEALERFGPRIVANGIVGGGGCRRRRTDQRNGGAHPAEWCANKMAHQSRCWHRGMRSGPRQWSNSWRAADAVCGWSTPPGPQTGHGPNRLSNACITPWRWDTREHCGATATRSRPGSGASPIKLRFGKAHYYRSSGRASRASPNAEWRRCNVRAIGRGSRRRGAGTARAGRWKSAGQHQCVRSRNGRPRGHHPRSMGGGTHRHRPHCDGHIWSSTSTRTSTRHKLGS